MQNNTYDLELRLFVEETCADLCRFHHVVTEGIPNEQVRIRQEVDLGVAGGAFADIEIKVQGARPYFMEVKSGYQHDAVLDLVGRKYGPVTAATDNASKVIVVVDENVPSFESELVRRVRPGLTVEIWDQAKLVSVIREAFGVEISTLDKENLLGVRMAIDRKKGVHAFGEAFIADSLQATLLWHFGSWSLRRIQDERQATMKEILPPGLYKGVAVVFADLSGFSSYVRDTREDDVVRHVLTMFYTKTRWQVLDAGGMLYQFLGDGVIGLFGIPEHRPSYLEDALECAASLIDIGNSVSREWQRQIDREQSSRGCHIGIALGDLNIVPLRPFSISHMGAIADSVNMAARLASAAGPNELVVSNSFFQRLPKQGRSDFQEMDPVEAKNVGRLRAWKRKFARLTA